MPGAITDAFLNWLGAGPRRIGEIALTLLPDLRWDLRHVDDTEKSALTAHQSWKAARHIANLDDAGKYRPLKTAANLPHGWKLLLASSLEVRRALDYFYPAMIGVWHSYEGAALQPVFLRETLGRQTGMYRVTQKVTDAQARETIDRFCSGCLKHRLWEIDAPNPDPLPLRPGELPLICHEACNLLIAEIRKVVKSAAPAQPATVAP